MRTLDESEPKENLIKAKVLDLSHYFTQASISTFLKSREHKRLTSILSSLRLSDGTSDKQIIGLACAMLILGGPNFENFSRFMNDVAVDRR